MAASSSDRPGGTACGQDRLDDRRLDAGLLGLEPVRVPLERRAAGAAGDQDGELRLPRRQRGAVAQQLAQRLPAVRELGVVQRGAQRALDLAARAGDDLVVDRGAARRPWSRARAA